MSLEQSSEYLLNGLSVHQLKKDGTSFRNLRVIDPLMKPFSNNPALPADNPFSVGSFPYGINTQGTYEVAGHFVGANIAFKLSATGSSKIYYGQATSLVLGGPYTGSPFVIGHDIYVNNRLHTSTGVATMYGINIYVNVEGDASESNGIVSVVQGGSSVACPTMRAGWFEAAAGHIIPDTLIGLYSVVNTQNSSAGTIAVATIFKGHAKFSGSAAITDLKGLDLSGWTGSPVVTTSYGIYADTAIDKGTTKWFIYSISVSPSMITGAIGIGGSPNANAMLDIQSTTKAFMPPRMTTAEKNNVPGLTAGMVVYDSTLNKLCVYTGAAWQTVTSV